MVTLHEATSSLNNANGFTVRRDGHHPKIIMIMFNEYCQGWWIRTTAIPESKSGTITRLGESLTIFTKLNRNLQRAGSRIRPGDTYLEGRYVSSYTIPALCRLKLFMATHSGIDPLIPLRQRGMIPFHQWVGATCESCAHFSGTRKTSKTGASLTMLT